MLNSLPGAETAHLLESSPPREREILWRLLSQEQETEVLQYLGEEVRVELLRDLPPEELVPLIEDLDTDDLADLLQELPEQVTSQVLAALDAQNRERLEQVMSYPEDTAGGLMNTDVITVRPEITFSVVQRYLHPEIWEQVAVPLLVRPFWEAVVFLFIVFFVLGSGMVFFARRRRPRPSERS
ncbi:MAG: hypothetical protein VW835_02395 [Rickettsiales bacterium]